MSTEVSAELPAELSSVRVARDFVTEVVASASARIDEIYRLLVSEIVSNAVLHAATPFRVRVSNTDMYLRVEVTDGSPLLPVLKDHGPDAITGRGLHIVSTAASRWGVTPSPPGKAVWFELDHVSGAVR